MSSNLGCHSTPMQKNEAIELVKLVPVNTPEPRSEPATGRLSAPAVMDITRNTLRPLTICLSQSTAKPFPFMDLPLETRLQIIEYTVISASSVHWKGCSTIGMTSTPIAEPYCNGRCVYVPPNHNIASLLLVSRELYVEAAPTFYTHNTFRFRTLTSDLPIVFGSIIFTANVRHLTIGVSSRLEGQRGLGKFIKRTDAVTSASIAEIVQRCPNLRAFVNHIPQLEDQAEIRPAGSFPRSFARACWLTFPSLRATLLISCVFLSGLLVWMMVEWISTLNDVNTVTVAPQ